MGYRVERKNKWSETGNFHGDKEGVRRKKLKNLDRARSYGEKVERMLYPTTEA